MIIPLLMLLVTSPIGTLEKTGERKSGVSEREVIGRMERGRKLEVRCREAGGE